MSRQVMSKIKYSSNIKNTNILYVFVSSYQKLYDTIVYIIKQKWNK